MTFTSLGAKGNEGPSNTSGYQGTPLEGKVQLEDGIQIWRVPATGEYSVEAWGASGASSSGLGRLIGGKGARIKGFLQIKCWRKVENSRSTGGNTWKFYRSYSRGWGWRYIRHQRRQQATCYRWGWGWGASFESENGSFNGDHGQKTENGTRHGGYNGSGGNLCPVKKDNIQGSGGGGFQGDGESSVTSEGGKSFINGGKGGVSQTRSNGGFGGGGSATTYPGGGGGFSGGGVEAKEHKGTVAGGGGSFNGGTRQENYEGVRRGDGKVIIKLIK